MKRFGICVLALVFTVGASAAFACDKSKSASGCSKTASLASAKTGCMGAATAASKEGCSKTCDKADYCVEASMARAMAMLPQMTYKVGDTAIECPKAAQAKSEELNEPIIYVVGDKSFHCKQSAMKALAGAMEAELATLAKVSPVVDGQTMHCSKMAAELAAQKHTKVQYCVAGVQFDCPKKAQAVADKLAAKMGEFRAACSKSGCAKTAASESGCAKTASAEKSGCSKSAETASAKSTGCSKSCPKAEKTAQTASAGAGCSKSCTKAKEAAETASVQDSNEDSPELAQAKQVVRQMVEFVSAQRAS